MLAMLADLKFERVPTQVQQKLLVQQAVDLRVVVASMRRGDTKLRGWPTVQQAATARAEL